MHQRGWLSSACYVRVPPDLGRAGVNAGSLRFGKPGIVTQPALDAERYIRPQPGLLVLFPAYLWHGVEPFESAHARLSVAFDAVPA